MTTTETVESEVQAEAPETIEKKPGGQKGVQRFDPFENPGQLAEQEAEWLNEKFPGLDIEPKHVRALVSNHSAFQKSDARQANRIKEAEERAAAIEERKAANEQRKLDAAAKKVEAEAKRKEREEAKAAAEAEREAKRAEKAAAKGETKESIAAGASAPAKVKRPRPSKAKVAADAEDSF